MADVRVDRAELVNRLKAVEAGLTPRDVLTQSSCVALVGGHAMSYNEDIFCRTAVPIPSSLTGAVPGKRLIEALTNMAADEVTVGRVNGTMRVTGNRQRVDIRFDEQIMLAYKEVEQPSEAWKPLPEGFCEALRMVNECVRDEKKGFKLSCVHFASGYIEACDNVQIIRHKSMPLPEEFVIRGRFRGAAVVARLDVTEFALSPKWVHFRNPAKTIISVRRFAEPYLDLSPPLKFRGVKTPLPRGLTEASKFANTFAQENGEDARVLIDIKPGELAVIGEGASGKATSGGPIKYNGPPIAFRVGPKTLESIVERGTEAEIGEVEVPGINGAPPRRIKKLRMDGGRWIYLTNLGSPPPPGGAPKPEASDESESVNG